MRDQMNQGKQLTKPLSQKKRYFQGGETKQMRKITAYLLIFALVFTLVVPAGVASAQTAGQKLKDLGLIQGNLSGDLMENAQWKRQDLVVALARMLGEESVAQATPKTHTFTDVTDPFYNGFLSWSVNKGYIQGHSATKFGYGEDVTNHQFVAIMLRALGHDTRGANFEAAKQLAVTNGLVPANVDWNAASNRGALYGVMLNTVDAKVVGSDKKLGEQLKLPGYYTPPVVISVKEAKVVDNKTVAVTFSDNVTQNFTLATALEANKETAVKVTYKEKEYEVKVTWVVVDLAVSSVTAVNARQLAVVFNQTVEKAKAEAVANYDVFRQGALTTDVFTTVANGANAALQADGKTVLLTIDSAALSLDNHTTTNRVVVKTGVGLKAEYTNSAVALTDTVVPTVVSATATGSKNISITFSEPINKATNGGVPTNIVLNDGAIALDLTSAVWNDSKRTLVVNTYVDLTASSEYTVKVNAGTNMVDYVGFGVVPGSVKFVYSPITAAPTVTLKSSTETTVTIEFSQTVTNLVGNANVLFTHTYNNATNQVTGTSVTNPSNDGKTFVINFGAARVLPPGATTLWIKYIDNVTNAQRVVDNYGNYFAATNLVVSTVADVTPPTATVALAPNSNTVIEVTFSEPVTGALDAANYTLKRGNTTVGFTGPSQVGSTNKYTITANSAMSGDYTLEIKNIKDVSIAQNAMGTQTYSFSVADLIAPFITAENGTTAGSNYFVQGGDNKKVRIYFSEAMNAADLADKTKYQNAADSNANPVVVTPAANNRSVYLEFANGVTGNLFVGGLRDTAGNVMSGFAATLTSTGGSLVGLDTSISNAANRVVAESQNTVKVFLSDLVSGVTTGDFEVHNGIGWVAPASFSIQTVSGKSVITLVLSDANKIAYDQWATLSPQVRTVSAANNQGATVGAKNSFGVAVNITATNVTDKIVPVLAATNAITTLDVNGDGRIDHIKISFRENMDANFVSASLFTVDTYTVVDAYASTTAPTSNVDRTGATVANAKDIYVRVTQKTSNDIQALPLVSISTGLQDVNANKFDGVTSMAPKNVTFSVVSATVGSDAYINAAEKAAGFSVAAVTKAGATLYLVPSATASTVSAIQAAAIGTTPVTVTSAASVNIVVTALQAAALSGTYHVRAIDADGSISSNSITITVDETAPTVVSATFASATSLVIVFDEAVIASVAGFTAGTHTGGTFAVSAIAGSGTSTITLTVAGTPAIIGTDVGLIDIAGVNDLAGNVITPVTAQAIAAGGF